MKHYPTPIANPDFVVIEKEILHFWQENNIFEKSIKNRPDVTNGKSNNFVFYDGPPFANGLPHYGHLLTGYVKDIFARYQAMKGKKVERRFGWDCHGLPAEMEAEKELGISGRQAIIGHGIDNFNDTCRTSVMKYSSQWENYINRQARWVNFSDSYKTMDKDFMESVLWAFNELHKKGLIYEDFRVMPYSWAAETPLSVFETKLDNSFREREDKAVYVSFELIEKINNKTTKIIAWTTTPWTLPSNLALGVSKNIEYVIINKNSETYIIAKTAMGLIEGEIMEVIPSSKLIGLNYKPLFPYFSDIPNAFKIIDGTSFIETDSGTGIVHLAPAFGEEDQRVCGENNINIVCPVNEKGRFTDEIYDLPDLQLKGLNVIAEDTENFKFGKANELIINWLKNNNKLIKQEQIFHNYPHCWRTDTPLIHRAMTSIYVNVAKIQDRMVELNQEINWIPEHIKDGLFGNLLKTAPDWSISRNRFWGCPIPVWKSDNPENKKWYVFGSIAELEEFFGESVEDLHRPYIDNLTKADPTNSKYTLRRVEDVFDCWFESGSMPFAQLHYPFENKEKFEQNYPADFITEYVAQTRGWFNRLMILATALFDKPPFLNCICHGVVIDDETGLKYSKRLKNYTNPMEIFDKFGSDALRWLMISSPVMHGNNLSVDGEGKFIRDVVRLYIKPIWNAYNFFCLYANADEIQAKFSTISDNIMDKYILAKCSEMTNIIEKSLDNYTSPEACNAIIEFSETLNNWYIRRNRMRFWKSEKDDDKQSAYDTLYTILHIICRAAAPLLPFTLEKIFMSLGDEKSLHLQDYPTELRNYSATEIIKNMDKVQDICNTGLSIRNAENIRIRQPLASLTCYGVVMDNYYADLISEELNIKKILFSDKLEEVASHKLKINFSLVGKRLGKKMKIVASAAGKNNWKLQNNEIHLAGEILQPSEYEMLLTPKKKILAASAISTQDAMVVLDLKITRELELEGIARDIIRNIQQTRKDANLDISDRISLKISGNNNVGEAISEFIEYVKSQTLADEILFVEADNIKIIIL